MKYYYGSDLHIPCIYKIFNTHTKRVYIGQTITLKKRWVSGHSLRLKNNNHFNIILQNDFNKCYKALGHTDFLEFHIIELLPESTQETRNLKEWQWINEYKKTHKLYNIILECDGRKEMPQELKNKISETKKKYYKSEEGKKFIEKLANNRRGKSYEEYYGKEFASEIKKSISDNKLISMNLPEVKENLSKILTGKSFQKRFGESKAEEILEKMSAARKGKYIGKENSRFRVIENIKLLSPDGIIYTKIEGIKEFAEEHNLSKHHLCELLAGKRRSHHGWALVNDNNQ